jgi:hypothetical protein
MEATRTRAATARLQVLARFPEAYTRAAHNEALREAGESVNRISARMCRLQEIRRVAEPWQQQSLNRLMTEINAAVESAERATAALRGPNGRMELRSAEYRLSLEELSRAADAMRQASRMEWAQDSLALSFNP